MQDRTDAFDTGVLRGMCAYPQWRRVNEWSAIVAANWQSQLNWHVDQLIADALGTNT